MRSLTSTLTSEQKKMSIRPVLSWVFTSGVTSYTYDTDRILRCEHSEAHDSHKAELILQNADGSLTSLDLKGYSVEPKWGLITSAGSETSETAPLWVRDMTTHSVRGQLIARLTCFGIPDRLAEEKADDDYRHHWSSAKTVLDLVTEIADGAAVTEELTERQDTSSTYINLDDTLDGAGQRVSIPNRIVTKISFRLKKTGTPPVGDITFIIKDVETDATLASKVLGDANTVLTTSPVWYEVTLTTPVTIDKEMTHVEGDWVGGVWIYCGYIDGDASNYVQVSYNATAIKFNEWFMQVNAAGSPAVTEWADRDCAYRYKYTGAGIPVFQHCHDATPSTGWVVTDDTAGADTLLDSYAPCDAFFIRQGESRLNVIDKLLAYTKTERRFEADGEIHLRVPVTTGTTYDYEYSLASGEHGFFSKSNREALVIPNKIVVESFPDDDDQYTGSYTSAASYALMPVTDFIRTKLTSSDPQAIAIATAMISHIEVASQRGSASVPMNVGAELWDYVLVTDERAGDTRTGNIGYLTRLYDRKNYQMTFGFGGVAIKGVPGTQLSALKSEISEYDVMYDPNAPARWGILLPHLRKHAEAIDKMQKALKDLLVGLGYYDGQTPTDEQIDTSLIGYLKNIVEDSTPQLGGDLDLNGKNIDFPTTANISDCLDEDAMGSNSATKLATQQSIKAYADTKMANSVFITDATASRAVNTTYTNVTGKPVFVAVSFENMASDTNLFLRIHATADPPTLEIAEVLMDSAAFSSGFLCGLVPVGWKYRVIRAGTNPSLSAWIETQIG